MFSNDSQFKPMGGSGSKFLSLSGRIRIHKTALVFIKEIDLMGIYCLHILLLSFELNFLTTNNVFKICEFTDIRLN